MFGPLLPNFCGLDKNKYALSIRLFNQLNRFHRASVHILDEPPLKRGDVMLLGQIQLLKQENGKAATVSWLARRMEVTPAAISQKVNVLVKAGYLRRVEDADDRRVTLLEITEKGCDATLSSMRAILAGTESALRLMGPEKLEQMTALMDEFADLLAQLSIAPETTPPKEENPC